MTTCPTCEKPLEQHDGMLACVSCKHWWMRYPDGAILGPREFRYTVCVACGKRIIDNPAWMNNHRCPPKHDAARIDREYTERGRSVSDRLADGFDLMNDIGGEG